MFLKMVNKKVSNKGMNKNLIIGIIVVALLLVGGFLYFNNQKEVGLSPAGSPPLKVVGIKGGGIFSYQKTDLCPTMILNSKGEKLLDEFPLAYFYLKSSKDIVLGNLRLQVGRYHESVDARLDIIEDYRAVIYNLKTPWEQEDLGVIESYVDKGRVYVRWDDLSVELEKGQKYGLAIIVNLNKKFNVDDLVEVFLALTKTGHNYHLSDDNSISYKTINGAPRASKTTVFDRANCPRSIGSCTDTDGGINYAKKGSVSGKGQGGMAYGPDVGFGMIDTCGDSKTIITEWYCDGINPKVSNYECPNGCFNGACLDKN